MFNLSSANESITPVAFLYDEDHTAYEEPKLVKWLRARKETKPYQPNLILRVVEGGAQDSQLQKAA